MKHSMHLIMLSTALMLCSGMTQAADAKRGEALYQANCTRCHDTSVHTRPNRIIHSLSALENRVRFCETNARLKWPDDKIEDVTAYLNKAFYKLK